jgi:hypothetical protein
MPARRLRISTLGTSGGMESVSVQETANKKNLNLLVTLRWLAVGG